jgi:Predicted transcriptional regulators
MYEDIFAERLSKLRIKKGISARNMSLSLGQSADYINKIENKKRFPSLQGFFNICEYLELTPSDFFDVNVDNPLLTNEVIEYLNKFDDATTLSILDIIKRIEVK